MNCLRCRQVSLRVTCRNKNYLYKSINRIYTPVTCRQNCQTEWHYCENVIDSGTDTVVVPQLVEVEGAIQLPVLVNSAKDTQVHFAGVAARRLFIPKPKLLLSQRWKYKGLPSVV